MSPAIELAAWSIASASSTLAGSRTIPFRAAASSVASTSDGMAANPRRPAKKFRHRDLVGGVQHGRRRAARLQRLAREPQRRKADQIGRLEGQARHFLETAAAGPARRSGPARRGNARSECACPARRAARSAIRRGIRRCPCTIDCGCTNTSMSLRGHLEQVMRLDQFEALVHQGRGIDRDFGAHGPVRMAQRLFGGRVAHRFARSRCGTGRRMR